MSKEITFGQPDNGWKSSKMKIEPGKDGITTSSVLIANTTILLTEGLALLPRDPDGAKMAFLAGGLFALLAKANDYARTHQQQFTGARSRAEGLGTRNPANLINNSGYLKFDRTIRNGI